MADGVADILSEQARAAPPRAYETPLELLNPAWA